MVRPLHLFLCSRPIAARFRAWAVPLVLAFACLASRGRGSEHGARSPAGPATWRAVRDELVEDYLKAQPAFAVVAGRHEFDGLLPDWSRDGIAAEIRRLRSARERALSFNAASLDEERRFERAYLVARVDSDLFWLETAEDPFRNPAFYTDGLDPAPYVTRNYAPLETRMRAYTKYARSVQEAARQIRGNLRTPLALPLLERGISAFGGFADFYLNYTMGKLMIRRLREDWTATRGGKAAWRAFHDQFLAYGGPPVPMVRGWMMGNTAGPLF